MVEATLNKNIVNNANASIGKQQRPINGGKSKAAIAGTRDRLPSPTGTPAPPAAAVPAAAADTAATVSKVTTEALPSSVLPEGIAEGVRVAKTITEAPRVVEVQTQRQITERVVPEVEVIRDKPIYELIDVPVDRSVLEGELHEERVETTRFAELRAEEARLAEADVQRVLGADLGAPAAVAQHALPDQVTRVDEAARLLRERELVRVEQHIRPIVKETHYLPVTRTVHVPVVETVHEDPTVVRLREDLETIARRDKDLAAAILSSVSSAASSFSMPAATATVAAPEPMLPSACTVPVFDASRTAPMPSTSKMSAPLRSSTTATMTGSQARMHASEARSALKHAAGDVREAAGEMALSAKSAVSTTAARAADVLEDEASWFWQNLPTAAATAALFTGLCLL